MQNNDDKSLQQIKLFEDSKIRSVWVADGSLTENQLSE